MLTLNIAGLSEAELKTIVADHCSAFGCLTTVRVLPPEARREYGIALVEMSSSGEANNLARNFGDSQYGSRLVVIKLYHGEKATTKGLTRDLRPPMCEANPTHSSLQSQRHIDHGLGGQS